MNRKKCFTLVELVVVIAIIGILSAVLTPSMLNVIDKAKAGKMVTVANTLETGCSAYHMDTGSYAWEYAVESYPGTGDHRLSYDNGEAGWQGPYIKTPVSRKDNPFDYWVWMYSRTNEWESAAGGQGFDLNNDGVVDTTTGNVGNDVVFYRVPVPVAELVNESVDGSMPNWATTGQVEYSNNYYVTFYLGGGR